MIGIFDSGIGGLNMLRYLQQLLPEHDTLYLGDQLDAPFGNRSAEAVTRLTQRAVKWLIKQDCKLILIACNTASADALRAVQAEYGDKHKILGCLIPAVEQALQLSRFGRLGVIATRGTVASGNYAAEVNKLADKHFKPTDRRALSKPVLTSIATPLLVPLIEENWANRPETKSIVKKYLLPFKHVKIDTCILGCTHYGLIEQTIAAKLPAHCQIIDSAKAQAKATVAYLENHPEIVKLLTKNKTRRFVTTDSPERFLELGNKFLAEKMSKQSVEKVIL